METELWKDGERGEVAGSITTSRIGSALLSVVLQAQPAVKTGRNDYASP